MGAGMNNKNIIKPYFFGPDLPPVFVTYYDHHSKGSLHSHESFYELVFIKHGSALHSYEGKTQVLTSGDIFIILPGESHAYIRTDNTALYNCLFLREAFAGIEHLIMEMPGLSWLLTDSENERTSQIRVGPTEAHKILVCLDTIITEQENRFEGWKLKVLSQLESLLVLYARSLDKNKVEKKEINANYKHIMDAVAFMEKVYNKDVSVDEVARISGLSSGYFSRQFKNILGTSPSEYARSYRMAKAAEMLRIEEKSIAEISEALGFSGIALFSRQFKQVTGFTPSGFRKKL